MTTHRGRLSGEALVAHNLRIVRKAARLSQEDVAERMTRLGHKFHQTQVAKIERGARPIRYDEVIALAKALNVPLFNFMTEAVAGEGEPEFELQEAAFRVEAAEQEWRTAHDIEQAAKARLEEAEREYRAIAERLGVDLEEEPPFYPAPNSPWDPLRKEAGTDPSQE
ncbi:helix-turn-helix domain-containing protein [Allostreptomyces psammosilenae]|uniref:Transcriptional regulator with XRE-family HTH domain n=1 Tax=Allostreptomyces psammosilenae TaxID=1892865 RepID=A0A853A4Y0_9ACTN|nr:helix-turn-helix transcriptional regulator [Allostreptomyces psammosilenae]NYI05558.1 transcriptional regulator with XRE-family HTH domain [Allostreptomyces psammosilenae]